MWMPSAAVQRRAGEPGLRAGACRRRPCRSAAGRFNRSPRRRHRFGGKLADQPLREHGRDLPPVVGMRDRRAHRAHLLLHELAELRERLVGHRVRRRARPCRRAGTAARWCPSARRAARRGGHRPSRRARRRRRAENRSRRARAPCGTRLARWPAGPGCGRRRRSRRARASGAARRPRHRDPRAATAARRAGPTISTVGVEHEQHRGEIAGKRRVAMLALRRDVADVAAVLQAEIVRAAPPLALVVEHATRVEAQVAAERRHRAMAGSGDRWPRPRPAPAARRAIAASDAIRASVTPAPIVVPSRSTAIAESPAMPRKIDQHRRRAEAVAQIGQEIGAAGQRARTRRGREQRRRLGERSRAAASTNGAMRSIRSRALCDALPRDPAAASRRAAAR